MSQTLFDIIVESFRAICSGIILVLLLKNQHKELAHHPGWRAVLGGFALLFLGMVVDITDNFPSLSRFVILGQTDAEAVFEKIFGYLGGAILLAWGIWKLAPALEGLLNTRRNLRITLLSIADGVVATDPAGCVTLANPVATRLLGVPAEALIGKPLRELFHPEGANPGEPATDLLSQALELRQPTQRSVVRLPRAGQPELWLQMSAAPIRNESQQLCGAVLVLQDISHQRATEQQLLQTQKLEALGQLTGGIAHDFNNLLAGILGGAELLRLSPRLSADERELADAIVGQVGRGSSLTAKLLAFARKGKVTRTPLDAHTLVRETAEILQRTIDPRCIVQMQLNAESTVVAADAGLLQNALLNLGINSWHAMPEGGTLLISTRNLQLEAAECEAQGENMKPGGYLELSVQDWGTGIAPEVLGRLFEPFFTTKQLGKGTGLGLSMVLGTLQELGGTVRVESELGAGSIFRLLIPLSSQKITPPAAAPIRSGMAGRVLVIDDEEQIRSTVGGLLEHLGFNVLTASGGKQGVALFRSTFPKPDFILLDMAMPDLSGAETFHLLKKEDSQVQVVLCSGVVDEATRAELSAAGIRGFLQKPYRLADLAAMLDLTRTPETLS
jgi:PAS domain S-box-containing protein